MKLLLLILLFAFAVFTSPDIDYSDRDEAVIISVKALSNGNNPYDYVTSLGNPITTGYTSMILAFPFVLLFGNYQLLTFLFYAGGLIAVYRTKYFNQFAIALILLSPFIYRIIYYRLDELYWSLFYIAGILFLKSKWKYLLLIPLVFSRNYGNFDYRVLLVGIDYWLLIIGVLSLIAIKNRLTFNL